MKQYINITNEPEEQCVVSGNTDGLTFSGDKDRRIRAYITVLLMGAIYGEVQSKGYGYVLRRTLPHLFHTDPWKTLCKYSLGPDDVTWAGPAALESRINSSDTSPCSARGAGSTPRLVNLHKIYTCHIFLHHNLNSLYIPTPSCNILP